MRISEEDIKKVRESNDIVEVIGEYISLEQKGKNYFCVCPFHDDHSPSMSISPEKQIFRCFVCETSGNVISFIQEYLKVSFLEAVDVLSKRAGLSLNIKEEKKEDKNKIYYDIYNIALAYYKNNLNSKAGESAREYLNKRGLNKETIDYFDIALSLNSGLINSLSKKYSIDLLKQIGLCNNMNSDLFRNRIMFTLRDIEGNVVGFSARKYTENNEPKYINSSESIIFKKGSMLYNFYRAKDAIRKQKEIIISEGQMEVIRMHTIGIDYATALMGTSFTNEHLNIIKHLKCKVILNLDQDEAGKRATISIGDMLLKEGIESSVIVFSGSKDADEYILKEGKDAFINALRNRITFIDFKLDYLKKNKDLSNANELSDYINESIKAINDVDDDILRELKIKELSDKYSLSIDLIKSKITNNKKKIINNNEYKTPKNKRYNKYDKSELRILYLMMIDSKIIKYYENHLGYLNDENRKALAFEIINYYNSNKSFDISDFICYTTNREELKGVMDEVLAFNKEDEYTMDEVEDYFLRVKELRVKKQINLLTIKMKDTLDINEKIKLARRIENMKKEVLKW